MAGAGPAGPGLHQQPRHCQPHGRHHLQVTILLDILFGTMGMFGVACGHSTKIFDYLLYLILGVPLQFPPAILSVVQLQTLWAGD